MGNCVGSVLRGGGRSFAVGDYLTSVGGMFHAILLPNAQIQVSYGSDPAVTGTDQVLWTGGTAAANSQNYRAVMIATIFGVQHTDGDGSYVWQIARPMGNINDDVLMTVQDDGQFVMVNQTTGAILYTSGVSDTLTGISDLANIEYDVANAVVVSGAPNTIYHQTARNDTDQQQVSTISGTEGVDETESWENSFSAGITIGTTVKTGIPVIASGEVEVSVNASYTYTWGGSTTTSHEWSFEAPITLAPHTSGAVLVAVSMSTITVPYSAIANLQFSSGKTLTRAKIRSTYTGTTSHDIIVTFAPAAGSDAMPEARLMKEAEFSKSAV